MSNFEDIVSQLPFPVAFRCRFILTRADRRSAIESIIDAYEALVKFLALTVISDYLRGIVTEPQLDGRLKRLFSTKISPGQWVEILRETLRVYCKTPDKIFMPELLDFYFVKGKITVEAKGFEGWVNRRNEFRGHAKRLITDKIVEETWEQWWPEFRELIGQFVFLTSYEMIIPATIQRGTIKKAQICTGPEQFFLFNDAYDLPLTIKGVEAEESLMLVDKRKPSRQLLLYPFVVVRAPADLYLFEQGERHKGNLQRVVFASLGPGEALEIRRKDEGRRIIEDIERKLKRLGEIGITLDSFAIESMGESPESVLLQEAARHAAQWATAGYAYHIVEGISERLKAFLRHPPVEVDIEDNETLSFLLVAALHFGGNWPFWVERTRNNTETSQHLIRVLNISYIRPRLRALYALQVLGPEK